MVFYYIRIYIKLLLLLLFKIRLVNEFESDKLLKSNNCPIVIPVIGPYCRFLIPS
jgi:hypothetical protein